jgi:hypothetical protein
VHGDQHPVFRIELLVGDAPVAFHAEASPSLLRLQADAGNIDICIAESDRVRFRGHGVSLRLIAQEGALAIPNYARHWEVNSARVMEKYMLWATHGDLQMDAPWTGNSNQHVVATFSANPADLRVEGEIDTYPSVWTPHSVSESFDESVRAVEQDYGRWLKRMPSVPLSLGPLDERGSTGRIPGSTGNAHVKKLDGRGMVLGQLLQRDGIVVQRPRACMATVHAAI